MRKGRRQSLRNRYVNFRICDVHVPESTQVLSELHGRDLLHGRVIDLSDSGARTEAFVVVDVEGLSQAVVVPVEKIVDIEE